MWQNGLQFKLDKLNKKELTWMITFDIMIYYMVKIRMMPWHAIKAISKVVDVGILLLYEF